MMPTEEVAVTDNPTDQLHEADSVSQRRGGITRAIGIGVSLVVVLVLAVPGVMIASRSNRAPGSYDDVVLILLAIIVLGPVIYLVGAIVWAGRLGQVIRAVGFSVWVLVAVVLFKTGIGLVMLIFALTVIPTLRRSVSQERTPSTSR